MEEALDLRIHNRRRSVDEGIPPYFPTYYSSRVQFVLNTYNRVEENNDDGDLMIVEATGKEINPPMSPSPGTRSSDTDTDKGSSPFQLPSTAQGSIPWISKDVDASNEDAQTKSGSSCSKYTSKHLPNVDRMLKPTRLMCFLCDQKAKNGKTLETHIQKSHFIQTAQGRFLCCTECGYRCEAVEQLKSHFETNHSLSKSGETKVKAYYPCSHCSRMYRKQSLLDAHMRLVNQKDMWKKNNVYVNT